MRKDVWPSYCRHLLAGAVCAAADQFPERDKARAEQVHGVRKTLKEARAIARLFLPRLGETARVTIAALAVARRRVGRARDLDVMEDRLRRLDPAHEIAEPIADAIAREREAARQAQGNLGTIASRTQLNAIVRRIEAWDLSRLKDGDLVEALAKTYSQARRRGRRAFAGDDPTALHALRSRIVDLRYQLAAIAPAWPAALKAQSEALNALRDTLGEFNDLHLFETFAVQNGGLTADALAPLKELIARKQKKLRRRAKTEFDRLFVESPDSFAQRLEAYLKHPVEKPKRPQESAHSPRRTAQRSV